MPVRGFEFSSNHEGKRGKIKAFIYGIARERGKDFFMTMSGSACEFLKSKLPTEIFRKLEIPETDSEIEKGGGTRRFFRALFDGKAAVVCLYDDSKAENFLYAGLANFLSRIGVPAPAVFFHDVDSRILVMEDLGATDLWTLRSENRPEWRKAYFSALENAAILHRRALPALGDLPIMRDGFNADYYKWERDYFLTNAAKKAHKLCITGMARLELEHELAGIAEHLLAQTPQLVHRDFQSQNLMWHAETACFIDFQGARIGTGWYDVASLLFDPYVTLSAEDRNTFFEFYCDRIGAPEDTRDALRKTFLYAAAQRLMQAIGAYFFLSSEMGKTRYRAFALPALESLKNVASKTSSLPNLTMLATELLSREKRRKALGAVTD